MSQVDIPKFNSPQEEIAYWKKCLEDKQQDLDEIENNFTEYQEFSKQLEEEMESELKACEKKFAEIQSQHLRLKNEHENVLDKLNSNSKESSKLINTLQDEISKLQTNKQSLMDDKRKLEQENDYLERREREATASINDLTEKLERVLEENVWMQSELEESKAASDETIQRLRDDIKELRQELALKERRKPLFKNKSEKSDKESNPSATAANNPQQQPNNNNGQSNLAHTPSEKSKRENPLAMNIPRPTKSQRNRVEDNATSKRAGSLVLVSDLINLVTDLEHKISHYKSQKPISLSSPQSNLLSPSSSIDNIGGLVSPSSSRLLHSNSLMNFNSEFSKKLNSNGTSLLNSFIEVQNENNQNNLLNQQVHGTTPPPTTTTSKADDFQNNSSSGQEPFING